MIEPTQTEYYQSVAYFRLKNVDWFDKNNTTMVENLDNYIAEMVYETEPIYDENGRNEHTHFVDMDTVISELQNQKSCNFLSNK